MLTRTAFDPSGAEGHCSHVLPFFSFITWPSKCPAQRYCLQVWTGHPFITINLAHACNTCLSVHMTRHQSTKHCVPAHDHMQRARAICFTEHVSDEGGIYDMQQRA